MDYILHFSVQFMMEQVPQQDENKSIIGNGTEFKPLLKKVPTPVSIHISIAEDDEETKDDANGKVIMIYIFLYSLLFKSVTQCFLTTSDNKCPNIKFQL